MNDETYQKEKDTAHRIYDAQPSIHCPYFNDRVILDQEGFWHLVYSDDGERSRSEQLERFLCLPLGLQILKTTTTLQAYRKHDVAVGAAGLPRRKKTMQWWTFEALFLKEDLRLRVVVRKVDGGQLQFRSVMPVGRFHVSPKTAAA